MRLRRFLKSRDGAASVITALSAVALIGFTGLAVDVGSVYVESRRLQGTADLAALSAMQNTAQYRAAAFATVRENRWPDTTRVEVTPGVYVADRSVPPHRRFSPQAGGANAVRVRVTTEAPLYFARLFVPPGRMQISRSATASQTRLASFQIGSRLLSLQGGVANAALTALTGSSVSLSVMDYQSLLRADVDLLSFADALRTRLDLEAASFDETMSHRLEAPEALEAIADVLATQDRRAERAMRSIAAATHHSTLDGLDELIDLGPFGVRDHTMPGETLVRVSAMDLASAILQIAGGDRQVRLQLGAQAPGLSSTDVWLAIGERPNHSPWLSVTDDYDVIVRTAQMRLYVQTQVAAGGALAQVRLPILVEMASAQARLQEIRCSARGRDADVTLSVAPSIGSLTLGEVITAQLDNFRNELRPAPATLVSTALVRAEGEARIELGGEQWSDVRFSDEDIDRGAVKSVATRDAARATVSSLLGQTDLTVRTLGLGLNTSAVTGALRGALSTAAPPLDDLINGLTDLLGVRLGEADVRVNGVRCGGAALVA